MPCRYFEPQRAIEGGEHAHVRVPLIREYEGLCHAQETPSEAPPGMRFRCCNHGYSKGCCDRLPIAELGSASRFSVTARTADTLAVLWVEEREYAPARWQSYEYSLGTRSTKPETAEPCRRAQIQAFCESYLKKFAATAADSKQGNE